MKTIKKVTKNGVEFFRYSETLWRGAKGGYCATEYVSEEVILNCRLFEVEFEPERWRGNCDELFWYIDEYGDVCSDKEKITPLCYQQYEYGNYFQTEKEAEEAAKLLKQILLNFHKSKLESK